MNLMRRILLGLLAVSSTVAHCREVKNKLFKGIKRNTKFLVLNEPIVHLGLSEGLLHTLLFDLEIGDSLYTLDEHLLNEQNLKHTNVFHLLMDVYKQVQNSQGGDAIRYVFLCSAFTRVHPLNLELLLRKLNKYIYDGRSHEKGDIDVGAILGEYSAEVRAKRAARSAIGSDSGGSPAKDLVERMLKDEVDFLSSEDQEGSDKFVKPGGTYKGLFVGYGFGGQVPSGESGPPHKGGLLFPSLNSGIIIDITLLRRLCNHLAANPSEESVKLMKDNVQELSNYIGEHLHVKLTPFENACPTDRHNIFLVENEGGTNYDVYRYHLVLHLFGDYKKGSHAGETGAHLGGPTDSALELPSDAAQERPTDAHLAQLIVAYFSLAYSISTCASYSVRSKQETFVDYDSYHLMSIENEIKLQKYIKETEDVQYNSIEEYKSKLHQINKKYDALFDEGQRNWTHKNVLLAVVTSAQTEHRIAHVKSTYDNKENTERVFNSYQPHGGEGNTKGFVGESASGRGDKPKEQPRAGENLLNHDFLKSAFENENVDVEVVYFSDEESKRYDDMLHLEGGGEEGDHPKGDAGDSPQGEELPKKEKHIIYYLYEEYVRKNSAIDFFFICHDDTFVNVKTLIDVLNLTRNECTHARRHMFGKYVKAFDHMDEREDAFLKNFGKGYLHLYRYLKTNFVQTIDALKRYDYLPSYCKGGGAGKGASGGATLTGVPLYIGKRYSGNSSAGGDSGLVHYLAGASGMVLNGEAIKRMYFFKGACGVGAAVAADGATDGAAASGECDARLLNDAALGRWAKAVGILPIDFEGFFPNAPEHYPPDYLSTIKPVSFHQLNEGRTANQTKEAFFHHLVGPTQRRNKTNHEEADTSVDYLERNYKNTIDSIFHFFFYVNMAEECKSADSIIKATERIYSKMGSSKRFNHLFDMATFFTGDVEDMLHFQKRSAGKETYTNNYVQRKGGEPDGQRRPGRGEAGDFNKADDFAPLDDLGEADDWGEEDHLGDMDLGPLGDLDEEEQFDDDDYDYEKYLDGIEAHKRGSGSGSGSVDDQPEDPEWPGGSDDSLDLPPQGGDYSDDSLDLPPHGDGGSDDSLDLPPHGDGGSDDSLDLPPDGPDYSDDSLDLPPDGPDYSDDSFDLPPEGSEL
ncbi:unnamed protein product [Plasmodium vivax]|uniref:(malaria parasite P. vivax) hypothetical protein n=1 Tax=Plasmodium vivax TaxID=5855 RepID=A0A8S4HEL4_PLAVI|nr:unnamed protein product [Plasmodium vivax]